MAPAGGLTAPSLHGVPSEYRLLNGDGTAVALARTLLTLGIAMPADWARSGHNANTFVDATFARLFDEHGSTEIKRVFDLAGSITLHMDGAYGGTPTDATTAEGARTCFLCVYPGSATFTLLAPALDRLERIDHRLAATFYSALMAVLSCAGRPFGYEDATEYHEMMRDGIDPEELDQYEMPDLDPCRRPAYTAKRYRQRGAVERVLRRARDTEAARWVRTVLDLEETAKHAPRDLVPEDAADYFEGDTVPFILLVNEEGDGIQACFDDQTQHWGEYGGEPMFMAAFAANDRAAVSRAVRAYAEWLDILRGASALLQMLPGNDYAPARQPADWTRALTDMNAPRVYA